MKSAGLAILFLVVLNTTVFAQSDCTEHKSLVLPVAAWAMELATTATSDQAKAAQGNNAFAIQLYRQLRKQSGNLFFSPESISTALAMTYAGARADTAAEMAKTLHFTLPQRQLHPAVGALLRDRNTAHDGYQLKEADALWVQTGQLRSRVEPGGFPGCNGSIAADHQPMGRAADRKQDQGIAPAEDP